MQIHRDYLPNCDSQSHSGSNPDNCLCNLCLFHNITSFSLKIYIYGQEFVNDFDFVKNMPSMFDL